MGTDPTKIDLRITHKQIQTQTPNREKQHVPQMGESILMALKTSMSVLCLHNLEWRWVHGLSALEAGKTNTNALEESSYHVIHPMAELVICPSAEITAMRQQSLLSLTIQHCFNGNCISTGILKGKNNDSLAKRNGKVEIPCLHSFSLRVRLPYTLRPFLLRIDDIQIADPSHGPALLNPMQWLLPALRMNINSLGFPEHVIEKSPLT